MLFTPKVRALILKASDSIDELQLRETAVEEGMTTLQSAARQLVLTGETSIEEAIRVTGT